MKMKTKIVGLTFMFLFVIGIVLGACTAAPTMPYTVVGTLVGDNIVGVTVTVEDLSPVCYGSNQVVITNEEGQFAVTINNFCERVWEGDTIRATVGGTSVEIILQEGVTQISFAADEEEYQNAGGSSHSKDQDDVVTTTTTIPDTTTTTLKPQVTTTTIKPVTTTTIKPDEPEDDSKAMEILVTSLILIACIILEKKYKWGKGFIGLVGYYLIKKKDPQRAMKMLETALGKEKAGKYGG